MSNRVIIWPAKPVWPSARKLKEALKQKLPNHKILLVGSKNTKYKPKDTDIVINWGNSQYPYWDFIPTHFNLPSFVNHAVNKLETFLVFQDYNIPTPEWTTEGAVAAEWLDDGFDVVARHNLTGFGANGIELLKGAAGEEEGDFTTNAPLYVKYKKKKHEYRVHVFNGEVIDVTQKRKRKGVEVDYKIRNYKNGWVYCRDDIVEPSDLRSVSIAAVAALGLDFGAVDVIWNEKENKCYVLEVNTAPGLVGTTLESYANAFAECL